MRRHWKQPHRHRECSIDWCKRKGTTLRLDSSITLLCLNWEDFFHFYFIPYFYQYDIHQPNSYYYLHLIKYASNFFLLGYLMMEIDWLSKSIKFATSVGKSGYRNDRLTDFGAYLLDRSPDFLTSDNFKRSNEIVRTNWPIYSAIRHFVVMI